MENFECLLQEGKCYEYVQKLKGLASRRIARKRYKEYDELLRLGITKLINYQQGDLVIDLTENYINNYTKYNEIYDEQFQEFMLFIYDNSTEGKRNFFMKKVIKQCGGIGVPKLMSALGRGLRETGEIDESYHAFIKACDLPEFVATLDILMKVGYKSERELFISRACLEFVLANSLGCAKQILAYYYLNRTDLPLLNFTKFLVKSLELKNENIFRVLVEKYRTLYSRDENYLNKYLNKISIMYFGNELVQETGMASLLKTASSMFKMFSAPPPS